MFQSEVKSKIDEDISILVKMDNHPYNYICECGDASNLTVKEIQNANAIFISHTHIDHFVNFDSIIRHQIGIQRRVVICGPKGIALQVQARIKSYTWNLIHKDAIIYEIREVIADDKIIIYEVTPPIWELKEIGLLNNNILFKEKSFIVSGVLLNHKTPSLSYKFIENDSIKIDIKSSGFKGGKWVNELKEAFKNTIENQKIEIEGKQYIAKELFHLLHIQKGDTLGIIMDHAASEENHCKIKSHFSKSRRVYIESFYKNEDKEQATLNYHSYSSMSAKIMKESNVLEAIPVHFSRKYDKTDIEALITEFKS